MIVQKAVIIAVKDVNENPKVFERGHWQEFTRFEDLVGDGWRVVHSVPQGGGSMVAGSMVVLERDESEE